MESKNQHIQIEEPFKAGEAYINPNALEISISGKAYKLQPLVMKALLILAEADGEVVTRNTLTKRLWSDVIVGDEALTKTISKLRSVFANGSNGVTYIETVPKVGYRLLLPIEKSVNPAISERKVKPSNAAIKQQIKWLWGAFAALLLLLVGQWYTNFNQAPQERGLVDWVKPRVLSDSKKHLPTPKDMAAFRVLADSIAREHPGMKLRQPAPKGN